MFQADVASTGAMTLNVNSTLDAPVKKQGGGTAIAANDFLAGQDTLLEFDGTNWQMQGQGGNAGGGTGTVTHTGALTAGSVVLGNGAADEVVGVPAKGVLLGTTVYTDQSNVYGAFLQDFTSGTVEIPEAAGFTTNVNSTIGLDTTNNATHLWTNNADSVAASEAAVIAAGFLPKSTDATHGLLTATLCDEGVTTANTLTCTNTAGGSFVTVTTTAAPAGGLQMKQGAANSAGTTSVTFEVPAAVTSYVVNVPGTAPTNSGSAWLSSNASPGVGTWAKMPQTAITTGTAYSNASTTFSDVKGSTGQTIAFSAEASTNYVGSCYLIYSGSASTSGPKIQFTGPASPTNVLYSAQFQLTATPTYADSAAATAFSTSLSAGTAVTATTNLAVRIQFGIVNGVNAGTVTLQAAAQGAGTVTIQDGSYCQVQ